MKLQDCIIDPFTGEILFEGLPEDIQFECATPKGRSDFGKWLRARGAFAPASIWHALGAPKEYEPVQPRAPLSPLGKFLHREAVRSGALVQEDRRQEVARAPLPFGQQVSPDGTRYRVSRRARPAAPRRPKSA